MPDATPLCELDDCEQPAVADLHLQGKGCSYLCVVHRDELMAQPNWTLYELGDHARVTTPIASPGWRNRKGDSVEIDGTPARERAWRP